MKFTCEYRELLTGLEKVAIVADDTNSSDDIKNIIFRFEKHEDGIQSCTLIGVNVGITYKHYLAYDKYKLELSDEDLTNKVAYMQIKCKDLLGFLNVYKSTRRTKVEEVTFEFKNEVQIQCSVLEYDTNEAKTPYISNYIFNNIPIKPNMLPSIESQPLNRPLDVDTEKLKFIISTLLNTLQNSTTDMYSKLNFGTDYILAFNQYYVALMKNVLAENHIFESMKLSYKALSFLDTVICKQENLKVSKANNQLYVHTDTSESYIKFDENVPSSAQFIKMFTKEQGFSIDRILFKDVLKRLELSKENIEVTVKPSFNIINLRNSQFTQDIPLLNQKGMKDAAEFSMSIAPRTLANALIGKDSEFSDVSYIYYITQENGKTALFFTDDTDSWFTYARVNTTTKTMF
jgi:hypothetical protein